MRSWFISLLILSSALEAATVRIYNDSIFRLTATIFSATGDNLGAITVNPGQQMEWISGYQNLDTPAASQTPYTVLFTCPSGDEFGLMYYVSPGQMVTAMSSAGRHFCRPQTGAPNPLQ